MSKEIPVEVSARHLHLSQEDLESLFGKGHNLKKIRQLTQPSDFAAEEIVQIEAGDNKLNLRVVGPVRKETQVELSATDAIKLGIKPVLRYSGDIKNTPGAVLTAVNKLKISRGVVVALRHIHCAPKEAERLGIKNGQIVSVKISGQRELILNKIKVRVNKDYKLCLHIDTDEANAAGINKKAKGILI